MMPNVLQYPVAMMGVLRAGYIVVNVNPLYTPRELEHQLKDSGAEAIVILENFATTLQAVVAKTQVKHVVVATMGDMLGLKGLLVNLVVRRVKKMVPAWSLPGHVTFQLSAERRRAEHRSSRPRSGPTTSPSCNIRAARPASPRARRCCTATCWPMSRRSRCGWRTPTGKAEAGRSHLSSARCRSTTSSR